ncbi:hypothetical protein [Gangjinia marincola]
MRKFLFLFSLILVFSNCESDDARTDNPFLLDVNVNVFIDLSLPQFNPLQFPNQPIYISGAGNKGLIVNNRGNGSFDAYDASDPNHAPNNCSTLSIDGIVATCGCEDENAYNIVTGGPQTDLQYPLLRYRVLDNEDGTLRITN